MPSSIMGMTLSSRWLTMSNNYDEKYDKPDLRRRLKEEIKQSDKGGKPGQWSARKSQMLVQEYEKQGGGYEKDEKDEAARSLEAWTEQNWTTVDGDKARQGEITKRYLPEEVWERLSEAEQQDACKTKKSGSQEGEQYVEWTPAITREMKAAGYIEGDDDTLADLTKSQLYKRAKAQGISGRSRMDKGELVEALEEAIESDLASQTKSALYEQAQDLDISGRSKMSKDELIDEVKEAKT